MINVICDLPSIIRALSRLAISSEESALPSIHRATTKDEGLVFEVCYFLHALTPEPFLFRLSFPEPSAL